MEMTQSILAFLLSFFPGFIYICIWRIPFHYPSKKNSIQILFGGTAAIFIMGYFSYAQAKFLLFFANWVKEDLIFLRSDIWALAFLGFMEGLFCFIPIAGWFDPKTYNNPIFQKKNTKGLILFTLVVIVLPFYIVLNAYTNFEEDKVEFVSYFNPIPKNLLYSKISSFKVDSENRTSSNSKGQNRNYSVIKLELILKDNSKYLILETEEADDLLAMKIAKLILFLKERQIPSEIPYILPGYSDWKNNLEYYLQIGK